MSKYTNFREHFVVKLKSIRLSYGMTQEQFAEAIGVSESTYKKVERNLMAPSVDFLLHLKEFTGMPIESFLCDDKCKLEEVWTYVENAEAKDQLLIVIRLAKKFGSDTICEIIGKSEAGNN